MIGWILFFMAILTTATIYFVKKYVVVVSLPSDLNGKKVSEIDSITIVFALKRGTTPQITIKE